MTSWYFWYIPSYRSNRISDPMIVTVKGEKVQSKNIQVKIRVELSIVFTDATAIVSYTDINSLLYGSFAIRLSNTTANP